MPTYEELHRQVTEHLAKLPSITAEVAEFISVEPSTSSDTPPALDLDAKRKAFAKRRAWGDEYMRLRKARADARPR